MNQNRKTYGNLKIVQGADQRNARKKQGIRMAGILLIFAYGITLLGVYTVYLKFSIDCKYMRIDEIKQQNSRLDIQIRKLEAEVATLKNYQRVERVLSDAGYMVATPQKPLYVSLDDRLQKVEKAELMAPRPNTITQ
jgi:cell division protein FtsL